MQRFFSGAAAACARGFSHLTEGVFVKGDETSDNRKRVFMFGLAANIRANLVGGNFFTGLLLLMNADDSFIGLMTMITTAANMLQIFAPFVVNRFKNRRRALIVMRALLLFVQVVFIVLIPLFPVRGQIKLILVGFSVLIVNALNAMQGPGLTAWHIKFIPQTVRARYFSTFNTVSGTLCASIVLLGSRILDMFEAAGLNYWGFFTLCMAAAVFMVIDIFMLCRMKEVPEAGNPHINLKQLFVLPFKHKEYLLTAVLCTFLWNLIANVPGAYYTVYLLENVKVTYTFITLVSLVNVPILIFVTPLWSKFVQKRSWVVLLCVTMLLFSTHYALLPFVTAASLWLYVVAIIISRLFGVGIDLAFGGIPYVNIPADNPSLYIGFYSTVANLGAFLGASAGRKLITGTAGTVINILGIEMISKQYWLFLVFVVMALFAGILYMVQRRIKQTDG